VSVSPKKKYLAVCEKSTRAKCTVWEIDRYKNRKQLPESDSDVVDFTA
jgi:hypothetical protein